jgi:hypothetical protein
MEMLKQNIEENAPELVLSKMKDQQGASGKKLELMLIDLQVKIDEVRNNLKNMMHDVNDAVFEVCEKFGQVSGDSTSEVKFSAIFDFGKMEELAEIEKMMALGLIDLDEAKKRMGIETEKEKEEKVLKSMQKNEEKTETNESWFTKMKNMILNFFKK